MTDANPTRYFKRAEEIVPIVQERGHCLATKRITVDGARVSYLYREDPDSPTDSGWVFLAGDESREYFADARNMELYDVNTIANYDRDIIQFLDHPVGCAYDRDESGAWRLLKSPDGRFPAIVTFPDARGRFELDPDWIVDLPCRFSNRIEDRLTQVLWCRGITLFFSRHQAEGVDARRAMDSILARRSHRSTDLVDKTIDGLRKVSYRIVERSAGKKTMALMGLALSGDQLLIHQAIHDEKKDSATVETVWQSLRRIPGA